MCLLQWGITARILISILFINMQFALTENNLSPIIFLY